MRYGDKGNSSRALYMTQKKGTEADRAAMDAELVALFDGPTEPAVFGPRFDRFAEYLRANRLGCPWDLMAYLAFIADDDRRYVPIKSGPFQTALRYYGDDTPLSGYVTWARYEAVLGLVDSVGSWLGVRYGSPPRPIEVQSYLWVVARCVVPRLEGTAPPPRTKKGEATEMARRLATARRRERTGLDGEVFCRDRERRRLREAGHDDLAQRVRLISFDGPGAGYDLVTFDDEGNEVHVEVKTTTAPRASGRVFWLSEPERLHAETDEAWRLWRVWDVYGEAEVEDLSNVVAAPAGWTRTPGSWCYSPQPPVDKGRTEAEHGGGDLEGGGAGTRGVVTRAGRSGGGDS